jgi:hypothetical protein
MSRELSTATLPGCDPVVARSDAGVLVGGSQTASNYSLVVVCLALVVFGLAGYLFVELTPF